MPYKHVIVSLIATRERVQQMKESNSVWARICVFECVYKTRTCLFSLCKLWFVEAALELYLTSLSPRNGNKNYDYDYYALENCLNHL